MIYPFKFTPIYQERIWGGRNLARLFGRTLPEGKPIGESWELADLAEGTSVVADGPLAGRSLTELTRELGEGLWGPPPAGKSAAGAGAAANPVRFPLLLKYLDAEETLSVQVHPDAEAARRSGGGAALKTECWYVVESRGGFLYKGLKAGVTRDSFLAAIRADRPGDVLMRYDVRAGDFHFVPAGTVHALGKGVVVAEIQTPSDTTYRVSDWGRGRQTHLAEAMECIRFGEAGGASASPQSGAGLSRSPRGDGDVLVSCDYFTVVCRVAAKGKRVAFASGACLALMVLRGGLAVSHVGAVEPTVRLRAGDTALLPAGLAGVEGGAEADLEFLEICPGRYPVAE